MKKQNKVVKSFAVYPESHEKLTEYSKRRGQTTSSYVSDVIDKVLSIGIDDELVVAGKNPEYNESFNSFLALKKKNEDIYFQEITNKVLELIKNEEEPIVIGKPINEPVMPVVLRIPTELKGKKSELQEWLATQCNALIKKMAP